MHKTLTQLLTITICCIAPWASWPGLNSCAAADQLDSRKPNILFIMVDDLGKEWISCYGAEDIQTPNIDRLAAEGMMFENAYCMPQCTPTRVTLLTGQYPFRHGWVNHWDVPRWGGGCHFDPNRNPTLGRIMKSAGYKTAVAGKWQISDFRVQPEAMALHGFDEWCMWSGYEARNPPSAERYWNPYIHTRETGGTVPGRFGPDLYTDFLIDFMKRHRQEPMFLYFPMVLVHPPFVCTPHEPDASGKLARHKAMVRYTDHLLGRLVVALEENRLRRETIIIWTTDNGTSGGVPGRQRGRLVSGGKGRTSEAGVCVPFIVNGPGRVPQGIVTDALTDFTDLLPTFAALAGVSLPEGHDFDGHSLAELITGGTSESPRKWIMAMGGGNDARLTENGVENKYRFRDRVFRNQRFKLYVGTDRQPKKLIDLHNDPREMSNILASPGQAGRAALETFMNALERMPQEDSDPIYDPLPPQEWDVDITARSRHWKQ